jgi:hypothetical protein
MATYTDQDKAALLAMVTRYTTQQKENEEIREAQQALNQRLAQGQAQIQRYIAAFAAFGFDIAYKSEKEKKINGFQLVRNVVGSEAYLAAFAAGGRDPSETTTRDEDGNQSSGQQTIRPELPLPEPTSDKSIRDLTLAELQSASANGTTATAIRQRIEQTRGTELHFKTVGMTLYRLSKDGLARREGRNWFFVPETKNPAGETAGS